MADTAQLVKTNSYGFFGYVVPGVVVALYLTTIVSYLRYGAPLKLLALLHQVPISSAEPRASGPYEYISFLLVFVVAAYIIGHLAEACAQMIYDRFYMRRIYGHRLRQLILDEGTDRKETHKNFYRASIASVYCLAFIYLVLIAALGRGLCDGFLRNAAVTVGIVAALTCVIGFFWWFEGNARKEEERAHDYLRPCESALGVIRDLLRNENMRPQDRETIEQLADLWNRLSTDSGWMKWIENDDNRLRGYIARANECLFDNKEFVTTDLYNAAEMLDQACRRMRTLKSRNTLPVYALSRLSRLAEIITSKFIDDERPIARQVKERFHDGFENALDIKCHPSLGSEVNRLPMWYIVENQKDLSSFIVKYRSQAAMMCNISGAFLLCTLVSAFAFKGNPYDREFAIIGIMTLIISMFTSLRYFHVHDNDYVKTLIYAFVICTTRLKKPEGDADPEAQ